MLSKFLVKASASYKNYFYITTHSQCAQLGILAGLLQDVYIGNRSQKKMFADSVSLGAFANIFLHY